MYVCTHMHTTMHAHTCIYTSTQQCILYMYTYTHFVTCDTNLIICPQIQWLVIQARLLVLVAGVFLCPEGSERSANFIAGSSVQVNDVFVNNKPVRGSVLHRYKHTPKTPKARTCIRAPPHSQCTVLVWMTLLASG